MPDEYSRPALSSSADDDLATRYGAWVATVPAAHPDTAIVRAKRAFVDILACMVAGSGDAATATARNACATWSVGSCTVVGAERHQSTPWAAFVNATAAHALDFDDNFDPARAHITAVLAPALLAVAEERGLTGQAVLDAYIVGLEIAAALGQILNPAHRDGGWHATATIGAVAVAAGCGQLMALNPPCLAQGINAAASFAGGTMSQFGTSMKAVHAGKTALGGLIAAQLAAAGITAGSHSLEGPYGLARMMDGEKLPLSTAHLGQPLAIIDHGLKTKAYPCCASAHRAIDGALALRARHGLAVREIVRVDVHLPDAHLANLMRDVPRDEREARFSLPYCLVVALTHGRVALEDFAAGAFADERVRHLMQCVHAHGVAASEDDFVTRIEILLMSGERVSQMVNAPKGRADNPLSDAELWAKFHACCDPAIGAGRATALAQALTHMETLSANHLMGLLRGPFP